MEKKVGQTEVNKEVEVDKTANPPTPKTTNKTQKTPAKEGATGKPQQAPVNKKKAKGVDKLLEEITGNLQQCLAAHGVLEDTLFKPEDKAVGEKGSKSKPATLNDYLEEIKEKSAVLAGKLKVTVGKAEKTIDSIKLG